MSLGKIEIKDETMGAFSFINKNGEEENHDFIISKIDKLSEGEKNAFTKFGGAKSPYTEGKIEKTLEITDSVIKHSEKVKCYTETILLHELTDHDDNENSMMEAEMYVIETIQKTKLTEDEKTALIESHVGFFEGNKGFYEGLFKTYREWYEEHTKEYEETKNHYQKICAVAEYLKGLLEKK